MLDLNLKRVELDSLSRESDAYKQSYDVVLKKFNETALQGDMNRTNVFLIDPAVAPQNKYSPKIFLNLLLSIFVGLFLGIGLAFLLDFLDDSVKGADELEHDSGLRCLALSLPRQPCPGRREVAMTLRSIQTGELQETVIGTILQRASKLSAADLDRIVELQRADGLLFGEAAIQLGLLTEDDVQWALASQYSYPYMQEGQSVISNEVLAIHEPFGTRVEAFRSIRSGLVLSGVADSSK